MSSEQIEAIAEVAEAVLDATGAHHEVAGAPDVLAALTEEEMKQQEIEDDADLKDLKEKLKRMQEKQPPKDKDEMINHLMERLESAEHAVMAAEEVITHERHNRKQISQELKARNTELRALIDKEKKKLSDKVQDQLEKTLQQALKEKMLAEETLADFKRVTDERNLLFHEVDNMFLSLRDEFKVTEKLSLDQQKIIENIEEELQQIKDHRDRMQHLSEERQTIIDKLNLDLDEAHGVISKLEEARIVLNRLLGPQGVLTEREREKFLKNSPGDQEEMSQSQGGMRNQKPPAGVKGANGANNRMLSQNNDYFYDKGQKQGKPSHQYGGGAGLMEDANDDDFWYQNPKANDGSVGVSGQYQGYANQQPTGTQGSRTGSRKGGNIVPPGRY